MSYEQVPIESGLPIDELQQPDIQATIPPTETVGRSRSRRLGGAIAAVALSVTAALGAEASSSQPVPENPQVAHVLNNSGTNNYAGYEVAAPYALDYTTADIIVPTITCPPTGTYDSSAWVGEGIGNSSDPLFQTGISMECVSGTMFIVPWWEVYPTNTEQDETGLAIYPGDKLLMEVVVDQHHGYFYLQDFGSDLSNSTVLRSAFQTYYSPAQLSSPSRAECIVEDPTNSTTNALYPLTDFGAVEFSTAASGSFNKGCDVTANAINNTISSSSSSINHLSGINVWDIQNASQTGNLATTDGPSISGDFNVTWNASS